MWIGGAVIALGGAFALGWTIFEPVARAEIENQVAALNQQGLRASYANLDSFGFSGLPLTFEARMTDVVIQNPRQGWSVRLPEARGQVSPLDPSAVTLLLPENFTVGRLTGDDTAGGPTGEVAALTIVSNNLTARLTQDEADAVTYDISADKLRMHPVGADPARSDSDQISYEAPKLSGVVRRSGGAPEAIRMAFALDKTEAQFSLADPSGASTDMLWRGEGVSGELDATADQLTLTLNAAGLHLTAPDNAAVRNGAEGLSLTAAFTPAKSYDLALLAAAADDPDTLTSMLSVAAAAIVQSDQVDIELKAASLQNTQALGPGDAVRVTAADNVNRLLLDGDVMRASTSTGATSFEVFGARSLTGALDRSRVTLDYPVRAAPGEVQPVRLSAELQRLDLSAESWAKVDPDNALNRTPAALALEAEMGVELLVDMLNLSAAESAALPPEERLKIRSFDLETFTFNLLGLEAEAAGAVKTLDDKLDGELEMTIKNWRSSLEALSKVELINPGMLDMAAFMLQNAAKPVDETSSVINLRFDKGRMVLNDRELSR